jgi:D-alanyl-D-alanine carboxypeptidase
MSILQAQTFFVALGISIGVANAKPPEGTTLSPWVIAITQKDTNSCMSDLESIKFLKAQLESDGNSEQNIAFRKVLYSWEELLHDEKDKLLHHRKFLRNFLIQLESDFSPSESSPTGASGMMQITGDIFHDMKARSKAYITYIQKLGTIPQVHSRLPVDIQKAFSQIISNDQKSISWALEVIRTFFVTKEWRVLLRSNKYLNAYFGSIYLAHMGDTVNVKSIPEELKFYMRLTPSVNYTKFNTLLRDKILTISPDPVKAVVIPEMTPKTYRLFLETLQRNPKLVQSIFAARRYNSSKTTRGYEWYGTGMREKDVYFIALGYATTLSMLSSPQYKKGYCKEISSEKPSLVPPVAKSTILEAKKPSTPPDIKPKIDTVIIPKGQKLTLDDISMGEGSIMVSEMKKDSWWKWKSEVIAKNFDNLKDSGEIASLTKIMTAYVVYELCREKKIDPKTYKITVKPEHVWDTPWASLKKPSQWTIEDAIDALVMKSQNTIAESLASEIIPRDKFITRMNAMAQVLGMKNTTFYTPSGLSTKWVPKHLRSKDYKWNASTEVDLQILINHTLGTPYPIWSPTQEWSLEFSPKQIKWKTLESADKNFLALIEKSYPEWSVVGTKTGYTKDSGKCVITLMKHNKTWRVFSIIGLNMTKKLWGAWDPERRIIRTRIIKKLQNMIG